MNTINSLEIPKRIIVKKDKVFSKKDIDIENTVIRGLLYKMFSNSAISSTIKRSYEITTEELLEAIERTHHTTEKEDKYLKIDFKLPLKDGIFIELQLKLKSLRYLKYNDIRITSSEWYRLQRTKSINHLQITACLDCDYEDIDLKNLSAESNIIACCGICVTSKWNPFYDEDLDYRANRGYSLSYDNAYKSGQDFKESVRNQYPGRTHVISDDCISYAQYKYKIRIRTCVVYCNSIRSRGNARLSAGAGS